MVADYGHGDLAFAEVAQRLALRLEGAMVVATPVPPFDTLSAGSCIGQLALTEGPADRIVFHNVAPRADEDDPRPENEGEELAAGDQRSLDRPLDPGAVPPVPAETPAPSGTKVAVTIGDCSHTATVSDGTFEVADSELSFAPGSSGWPLASGGERRFYELLLRGGSAAELFGSPAAGARVGLG